MSWLWGPILIFSPRRLWMRPRTIKKNTKKNLPDDDDDDDDDEYDLSSLRNDFFSA